MTRQRTYILTVVSAGLFLIFTWAFADGLFAGNWWNAEEISSSAIFTYVFLALILLAGWYQAQQLPDNGAVVEPPQQETVTGQVHDPIIWQRLMGNAYWAILWLSVRFFVGREWVAASEHKLRDPAWMDTGTALQGFWQRAASIPEQGAPPVTYGWYRDVLQYMLDNQWYTWFAKVVAIGELLVGLGLIVGALVGIAAFFGTVMNFSFMMAGTASSNPILFGLSVLLVLAWKTAGYWGLDRYLLPALGAPWEPGSLFAPTAEPTGRGGRAPA